MARKRQKRPETRDSRILVRKRRDLHNPFRDSYGGRCASCGTWLSRDAEDEQAAHDQALEMLSEHACPNDRDSWKPKADRLG